MGEAEGVSVAMPWPEVQFCLNLSVSLPDWEVALRMSGASVRGVI